MVALKGKAVDSFLARPDPEVIAILVYGPDEGLVQETSARFIRVSGIADDPFCLVRLEGSDLNDPPTRLVDEMATFSLFGGRRLIRVRPGNSDISASVRQVLTQPLAGNLLLIEAGDLKPSSALRKLIEQNDLSRALPCYADDQASLSRLISERIQEAGKTIDRDALAFLVSHLGGDRRLTQQEIDKLLLYCDHQSAIGLGEVEACIVDTSQLSLDQMIDAAALGTIDTASEKFHRLLAEGNDCGVLLSVLMRHFHLLSRLRIEADAGAMVSQTIKTIRPLIFFKRHALIERQVTRWSQGALARACERIADAQVKVRLSQTFAREETERLLFALALLPGRRR